MKEFVDQMNNSIRLSEVPRRIVSLVPSQTELLFHLGLGDRVVGITKFCIHPEKWFRSKNRVGGTKDVDLDKVKVLKPDLIIGNKEENEKSNIEQLKSIAPVWMSDIYTLEDSLEMMSKLGEILDVSIESNKIISEIESNYAQLKSQIIIREKKETVLYLIWRNPFLAAGKNTFIDDMITKCGYENFIMLERYPEVDFQYESSPDFIFLSSEPYPFKEIHIKELQLIYPNAKILLVDGEMFSWYGSRLIESPNYFLKLIEQIETITRV